MASIRQIRTRIASVKNIQHITRAMKMVASARLHKAQAQLLDARPYAYKLREMVQDIALRADTLSHPLLRPRPGTGRALVVLTSDKGLCGGFNTKMLQTAGAALREDGAKPEIIAIGRKGINFFRRVGVKAYREWSGFWQELSWHHADQMGQEVIDGYLAGRWSQVTLVYNRFKSVAAQELVRETILPIHLPAAAAARPAHEGVYLFEPSADAILEYLLPRAVKNGLWHALLESKAAELAARMQTMENASRNAHEMIEDLTLHMNRARQAAITREIAELVGAAEAING